MASIKEIVNLLQIKGDHKTYLKMSSLKGEACVMIVNFTCLADKNPKTVHVWLNPGWVYPDMWDQLEEATRFYRGWINKVEITYLGTLLEVPEIVHDEGEILSRHMI